MLRRRPARLAALAAVALLAPMLATAGASTVSAAGGDDTPTLITPKGEIADEFNEVDDANSFAKLRDAYYETRLLSGDKPLSIEKAAKLRGKAIDQASTMSTIAKPSAASSVGGAWSSIGPNPSVQVGRTSNTLQSVSGRIGALAIRKDGTIILGAAQGGVWTLAPGSHTWVSRTNDTDTQAVGALAIAPSNDNVVYMGSGESSLSGDAYYGDGVYRSDDGGVTWSHVSGDFFAGNSTSDIVVDPANANHLYISTLRGRGGIRRTTPPTSQPYGVWESKDGGVSWTLLKGTTNEFAGATDLVMDPLNSNILWASFWGDGIYRSQNGGKSWSNAMGNLPQGQYAAGATRFSLGIAHLAGQNPVLYVGFDYYDKKGTYHPGTVWRNDSGGLAWTHLPTGGPASNPDSILDYCTTQCFYDNVVSPDPTNPNIVYVEGSYGYDQSPGSGGVYRSMDGGQTWKSLGYDLHPDFHALAFQPNDTKHIAIGNDGGVWQSHNRGGRLDAGAPLSAVDWENLNGASDGSAGYGLKIAQFTSMATVPTNAAQYWGGTQDNGTQRKSALSDRWFDQPSGDGGQVLVDPTNGGYVFGTYFGISPYRFTPATVGLFFGNEPIDGGINTADRAEFYVPWVMNKANPNQLFLGTYRLYRTDNAEAPSGGDVHWDAISGDLTTGCTGTAPNGARGCLISAVGVADGGDAVYTGSDDGKVFVNPHAVSEPVPTAAHAQDGWTDITGSNLPNRPVSQIAVDRSNWRIAYLSYAGFSSATPTAPGHVFKTSDGGQHWTDISSGLPDVPTNSVVLDPAYPNTLYAGTDIGTFVTRNGGDSWDQLGTGMPKVAAWQLDFDPSHRVLVDGTHGRGAYKLSDAQSAPALIVSKADAGKPVGPGIAIDYTVTVRNVGNADATNVVVTDPVPAHTTFTSSSDGATATGGTVTFPAQTVAAGDSIDLHFKVTIDPSLDVSTVHQITDDGLTVTADGGFGTTGSPHDTPIAPAHAVSADPTEQAGGAKVGQSVTYQVQLTNDGYTTDHYGLATSGTWTSTVYAADCTTPETATADLGPGDSATVCVKVDVPAGAANDASDQTTLTATSAGDGSVSATATMTTYAVATATLLVDEDGSAPDAPATAVDVAPIYKAALTGAGESFGYWDLAANPELPASYLDAHSKVVWFTGNSYPAPLGGYEDELAGFLDGHGGLLMSGQDILDQAAGTTDFVHDYLHIDWDGSETQNDKATQAVHGVTGNPVGGSFGSVPLDHSVLGANFEDEITPINGATAAFTDDATKADALTYTSGSDYHVAFLAFPLEAFGTATDKSNLVKNAMTFFGP